mgnify:CR=1 FL=1|jgi:uncharacterized protein (DUF305 family)
MKKLSDLPDLTPEETKFLKDMIEHHKMALVMAKDVLRTTEDNDIMFLAYSIMQTQSNEIALMQEMLRQRK